MSESKVNLDKVKKIKQIYKNIVFGYVRTSQRKLFSNLNNNPFYIIPVLVDYLCLLFYYEEEDEFNPKLRGRNIKISNNNKIINYYNIDSVHNNASTCYGKKVISSTINNTYEWKFKMLKMENYSNYINNGIDNANGKWINDAPHTKKEKASYMVWCGTKDYGVNGYRWDRQTLFHINFPGFYHEGDILTMTLKFDNDGGILIYEINGKKFMFKNIVREKGLEYRLAVTLKQVNESVQMTEFKTINNC